MGDNEIRDYTDPSEMSYTNFNDNNIKLFESLTWTTHFDDNSYYNHEVNNRALTTKIIVTNDSQIITNKEREVELQELFADLGYDLEFVGEYDKAVCEGV